MALGTLKILYIILIATGVIIQVLLYKNKGKNRIFVINILFAILLSYLAYTSLPINFTGGKILSIGLGLIAILALVLKLNTKGFIMASRVLLSISILGSLLQLIL